MKPHPLLAPLSPFYRTGVALRNWLFDAGILSAARVSCKVISVGNISAGGTGKTPFVIWLADWFKRKRYRVGVLGRGYKRSSEGYLLVSDGKKLLVSAREAGDEPTEVAETLSGVVVAVDEDRVHGAIRLLQNHRIEVLLLDDGFQHRAIHRDLNIVIFPADELEGPHLLLPAGFYREPLSNLKRANLIVLSRCNDGTALEEAKRLFGIEKPIVGVKTVITGLRALSGRMRNTVRNVRGKKVLALSGIGNPVSFQRTLLDAGVQVLAHEVFPDHHWYSLDEIEAIASKANVAGADMIITTSKDAVRLKGLPIIKKKMRPEIFVTETRQEIVAGKRLLERMLMSLVH